MKLSLNAFAAEQMRTKLLRVAQPYVIAVAATGMIALIRLAVSDTVGNFAPLIPFVVAVVVAAGYGGWKPGLFAVLLSASAADYLFIPERHTFHMQSVTGAVALGTFVLTGALISFACELLHRTQRQLRRSLETQRQLQAALVASDERKDKFLAVLAHELRNPLAPIRNAVCTLRAKMPPSAAQLEWYQAVIDRQVTHMTRLIDDLMEVARITQGRIELRKQTLDIREVLEHAIETSRPLMDSRRHTLTVSIPSIPVYVDADSVRLSQVFSNLLNNAAKYTPPGGRIHLQLGATGQKLTVTVTDSGIGIPHSMLSRIFEAFTQLEPSSDQAQEGLGIGLALARQIICLHGGDIVARSPGVSQGSEFAITLPVAVTLTSPIATEVSSKNPKPSAGTADGALRWRVLVADDNQDSASSLSLWLDHSGYQTYIAENGLRALEVAEKFHPDAAVLDIGMPQLDGYEVARRIRCAHWGRDIILIAITGWSGTEHQQRTTEVGFDHHLIKPVDPESLIRVLESARFGAADRIRLSSAIKETTVPTRDKNSHMQPMLSAIPVRRSPPLSDTP